MIYFLKGSFCLFCVGIDTEYFVFWVVLAYSQPHWQHTCFNQVFYVEASACVDLMKSLLLVSLHGCANSSLITQRCSFSICSSTLLMAGLETCTPSVPDPFLFQVSLQCCAFRSISLNWLLLSFRAEIRLSKHTRLCWHIQGKFVRGSRNG